MVVCVCRLNINMADIMTRLIGIQIEGLGWDTAFTSGVVFCSVSDSLIPTTGSYEWISALEQEPKNISVSVNPFKGTFSAPGFSFLLSRSARIARKIMSSQAWGDNQLSTALSATGTSVTFATVPTYAAGDVIFIGDEAIKLGTLASSTYSACTRGFFSTTAKPHASGDASYTRSPFWASRKINIVESVGGVVSILSRGLLSDVTMKDGRITIKVDSLLASTSQQDLNKTTQNFGPIDFSALTSTQTPAWAVGDATEELVRRQEVLNTVRTRISNNYLETFQIGDRVYSGIHLDDSINNRVTPLINPVTLNQNIEAEMSGLDGGDIYRVFFISRAADQVQLSHQGNLLRGISATYDLYDGTASTAHLPYHPLAIAMSLLISSGTGNNGDYDVLGERWGLNLDYLDLTAWADEIDASPLLAIDHLCLGWDGKPVRVMKEIREKLLKPFGYSFSLSATGSLSLVRVTMPDLNDRADALARSLTAYPDTSIQQDMRLAHTPRSLTATTGGTCFGPVNQTSIEITSAALRSQRVSSQREENLDLSAFQPSRVFSEGQLSEMASTLAQGVALGLRGVPVLSLRCASWRASGISGFRLGAIVSIADLTVESAWWIDTDGVEVELDSLTVRGLGIVTSISYPLHGLHMDVKVMMTTYNQSDFIRLRAPSGEVAVWASGTSLLTITEDEFSDNDSLTFNIGDELSLWTSDGTQLDTSTPSILFINNTTFELTLSGGFGTGTPVAGHIIRIAASTVFNNEALFTGIKRPFTYIGNDPDGSFQDVDAFSQKDLYGTQMFGGFAAPIRATYVFESLDNDVTTPLSATAAWPLDAFVQQRMDHNENNLLTRDLPASSPVLLPHGGSMSAHLGIRPFTSVTKMSAAIFPVRFSQGLGEVSCSGMIRSCVLDSTGIIYNDSETLPELFVDIYTNDHQQLVISDDERSGGTVSASTSGTQWVMFDVKTKIKSPLPVGFQGYAVLWFENVVPDNDIGSQIVTTQVSSVITQDGVMLRIPSSQGIDTVSVTRPVFGDLACVGARLTVDTPDGDSRDMYRDLLWNEDAGSGVNLWTIGPSKALGSSPGWAYTQLRMFQTRGLEWSVAHFDPNPRLDGALGALRAVLGEDCAPHATRLSRAHRHNKLLYTGVQGVSPSATYPSSYNQRWPRTTWDVGLNEATVALREPIKESASIALSEPSPTLDVSLMLLPTFCVLNRSDEVTDDPHASEQIIFADWRINVTVYRPSTTGWATRATLVVVEEKMRHHYTYSQQQGCLVSELAHYQGDFPYKEGSIYAHDQQYMLPLDFSIPVDYFPATDEDIFMVELEIIAEDISPDISGTAYKQAVDYARVQLALASWTVTERLS